MTMRILHKRQLARRLRGFPFHFSLLPHSSFHPLMMSSNSRLKHFRATHIHRVFFPSAITGKIKIKYVMQILKSSAARKAFGSLRVSASVMMSPGMKKAREGETKFVLFYRMELKAKLGLMFRKMTFFLLLFECFSPVLGEGFCFR